MQTQKKKKKKTQNKTEIVNWEEKKNRKKGRWGGMGQKKKTKGYKMGKFGGSNAQHDNDSNNLVYLNITQIFN